MAAVVGAAATVVVALINLNFPKEPPAPGTSAPGIIDRILVEIAPPPRRNDVAPRQPEPTSAPEPATEPTATESASPSASAPPPGDDPEPADTTPVDACADGLVWREAVPDDHVCVPPQTRDETRQDNEQREARVDPQESFGPDSCVDGYVWREAVPDDHVCVVPERREQARADNQQG